MVDDGSGLRALPVVEIVPDGGFYDYGARYTAGATEFFVPARLSPDVLAACADAATTVHSTLGLRHWSRVDLIVDAEGTPWFLEVNVAPGMTETSTYPQAVTAAGLDLGALVAGLVRAGHRRVTTCVIPCAARDLDVRLVVGSMTSTIRRRSSRVANSIETLPLLLPASTFTRVSSRSESREAMSSRPGIDGVRGRETRTRSRPSASPTATISSTERTDSPSATIRAARRSMASASSSASRARAWPAESTPAATRRCTGGGRRSRRRVLLTCGRLRPIRLGELLLGAAEVVEQLLVGGRLLERVELGAVQVLEQRVAQERRRRRSRG